MPNSSSKITPLGIHNGTLRKPIPENLLGTAVLDQTGEFEAGSYQSFNANLYGWPFWRR